VNVLETLEDILGIDAKTTANIEFAAEDKKRTSPSVVSETTADDDMAREAHFLVRLSAVVAYCALGMSFLSIGLLTNS
jgi:hypothetical protein